MTARKIIYLALLLPALLSCSRSGLHCSRDGRVSLDGEELGWLETGCAPGIVYDLELSREDDSCLKLEWNFKAEEDVDSAWVKAAFVHGSPVSWWMIPSVSYNGNHWGRGLEPKGAEENGLFRTWSYLRTPVPGAVYSEGRDFAVASWGDVPEGEGNAYSCSAEPCDSIFRHCLLWPEQEQPSYYVSRDRYAEPWARCISMKKGESHSLVMYLCVSPLEKNHAAYRHFLDRAWAKTAPEDYAPEVDREEIRKLGVRYFKESLWAEEDCFRGFSIGLQRYGDHFEQRHRNRYESGWCGQNISISNSLLTDYLHCGDSSSLEKAMACLDCWAEHCPLENGLFITHFDSILYGKEPLMDACNLGTTAMNYFEAYDLARKCGFERENYLDIAYGICDFALAHQDGRGCYARGWKADGTMIVRDGTVGCFLLYPMLKAYELSGKEEYLQSALKAYDHYAGELMRDGYTTAGALDTWCIDKESAITILRAALGLYRICGDRRYLDEAVLCSYYLSTWLWHYNAVYPEGDQMRQYDFHTLGMTSVSVQHHHLDHYACLWVPEWYELSRLSGDPQWAQKADAIWRASCQMISDGSLSVNSLTRPAGSQNEAYFQCHWQFGNVFSSPVDGHLPTRINDWLVAWPGAFRLETLRRLEQAE